MRFEFALRLGDFNPSLGLCARNSLLNDISARLIRRCWRCGGDEAAAAAWRVAEVAPDIDLVDEFAYRTERDGPVSDGAAARAYEDSAILRVGGLPPGALSTVAVAVGDVSAGGGGDGVVVVAVGAAVGAAAVSVVVVAADLAAPAPGEDGGTAPGIVLLLLPTAPSLTRRLLRLVPSDIFCFASPLFSSSSSGIGPSQYPELQAISGVLLSLLLNRLVSPPKVL